MARTVHNMHEAKRQKNDEFYTMEEDIQKEVDKYKEQLKGKVVYCNCDDYRESNFLKYLGRNFMFFELKKLICSSYKKGADSVKYYTIEVNEPVEQSTYFDTWETYLHEHTLECDGDFRSPESIELLEEADVVITNPPFSLFREFVAQLIQYNKKFLIIGNVNAVSNKDIFPLFKENKMWFGYKMNGAPMIFKVPNDYPITGTVSKTDEEGNKYIGVGGTGWYTNLDTKLRHEELIMLTAEENGIEYPHYDNYDAIEVSKTNQIPSDYTGIMGVPITFLSKYNPDQFEIIGCTQRGCHDEILETKKYDDYIEMKQNNIPTGSNGNKTNGNANLAKNDGKRNYFINNEGHIVQSCYSRIFIRNKHPEIVED